jgi:hypothetical protein
MMSPQQINAGMPRFTRPIKVLVCGGRKYLNREFMFHWLDSFYDTNEISHVITGGAAGADALANVWAEQRGIQQVIMPANWRAHGRSAGPMRNRAMADMKPDIVIAFPGGNGTASMCTIARENKIQVLEIAELFPEERRPLGVLPA